MDQICRNYAELVLKRGVNIQPGQVLVIDSPMWAADFDHLLMEEAFKLGAKDTIIHYAGRGSGAPARQVHERRSAVRYPAMDEREEYVLRRRGRGVPCA